MRNKRSVFVRLIACGIGLYGCSTTTPENQTNPQQVGASGPTATAPAAPAAGVGTAARAGTSSPQPGTAGIGVGATGAVAGTTAPATGVAGTLATAPSGTAAAGTSASAGPASGGSAGTVATASTSAGAGGMAMASAAAGTSAAQSGSPAAGSGTAQAGSNAETTPVMCPAKAMMPGETNGSVMVGSVKRDYILHVPASYKGDKPVPLVTDWHPILFDDTTERMLSGMQALSEKEGFIVVWPNGIDNAWNVDDCCTRSRDVDDVGFARELIKKLSTQLCIDPKRVYASGYSMGGGMSYKLACDAADIIAAVSPAAFQMMVESEWPCKPSRPITVMSTNGSADPVVPYAGGDSNPPNGLNVVNHFMGAQKTFERWAMLDGCTGMPEDKGNGCKTYTQCQAGVEVTLCTVQGGGHDPGDAALQWATLKRFTLP